LAINKKEGTKKFTVFKEGIGVGEKVKGKRLPEKRDSFHKRRGEEVKNLEALSWQVEEERKK